MLLSTDSAIGDSNNATGPDVRISGYVRTSIGTGISGVTVSFSNSGGSTITTSSGYYTHTVTYGWSGTATPSRTGYAFSPSSLSYSVVTTNRSNQNYNGTPITPTISGYVRISGGAGISGVTVSFSNNGGSTRTDSSGYYTRAVAYGWSGTATPKRTGYVFSPTSLSYSDVTTDQSDRNYTGTPITPTISGYVKTSGGAGISDVTVDFSNSGGSTTTDSSGYYTRTVTYGWSGTATPRRTGYRFSPTSLSYSNVTTDQSDRNYSGIPLTRSISGYVRTSGGAGISGVTMSFSNSGGSTTTNSSGYYTRAVAYGWSGTATPSRTEYVFSPASLSYSNVTTNQSNQNYTGTPFSPTISGYVRISGGAGISDVTVSFSNSGGSARTNSSGYYTRTVTYGWSGTATPSRTGYTFSPTSLGYSDVTTDQVDGNYTGTPITPTISGYVRTSSGTGISGVTMSFSNSGGSTTTDSSGYYTRAVAYGWSGTATPSRTGYRFSPTSLSYSNVTTDQSDQNYTGTPFPGSLTVTLLPAAAVSAGAQWNVDGGAWEDSGAVVSGLSVGSHTVNYKAVTGWIAPSSEIVTIAGDQATTVTRTYMQGTVSRDELVLDFGSLGLWHYDQAGGWKQWNTTSPSQMVTVDFNGDGMDELAAVFPGFSLYIYYYDSENRWQFINDVDPENMIAADVDGDGKDNLVASFIGYGLYYYYDEPEGWSTPINAIVPDAMVRYTDGVVCDFGTAYGLWSYNITGGWFRLNSEDPDQIVAADIDGDGEDELVVSFEGWGLYIYKPADDSWDSLNTVLPDQIVAADIDGDAKDELVVSFVGYGLFIYEPEGKIWEGPINTMIPDKMIRLNNGIACDFGATYGLWVWSQGGGWTQRNAVDPGQMTAVDIDNDGMEELVVSFTGYGLWHYDETDGWQFLNGEVPEDMKPINFYP